LLFSTSNYGWDKFFRSATILINNKIEILSQADMEASFKSIENETFKGFLGEMVNAGQNRNR
jgi:hypothetical protein